MTTADLKSRFSEVELLVLEGINQGVSQADLARQLRIDIATVKQLAKLIIAKLEGAAQK